MATLYLVIGVMSASLFVYLLVALFKPEIFP